LVYDWAKGHIEGWLSGEFQSHSWSPEKAQLGGSGVTWVGSVALGTLGFAASRMVGRSPVASFAAEQLEGSRHWRVGPEWINSDGSLRLPPNYGFKGGISVRELQPGQSFDRYGGVGGEFASPVGVPFEQRSLPGLSAEAPYASYEVVRPVPGVQTGAAAPWFGQPGGGTQYKLPFTIDYLLKNGFIRER
jgi:hypothetical protein